jgi:hypothetical protein
MEMDKTGGRSPEETLEYIRNFLSITKKAFEVDRFYYLFWGSAIPVWTGLSYLLGLLGKPEIITWAWIALYVVSPVYFTIRERKRSGDGVKTFAGRIYGILWAGVFLTAGVFFLTCLAADVLSVTLALSLISGLLGLAYWVGSYLLEKGFIRFLAGGWWLTAIGLPFLPPFWAPALMAAATVLLELIPGLLFFKRGTPEQGASLG